MVSSHYCSNYVLITVVKSAGEISNEALENIDNSFDNPDPLPSSHKLYTCSKYFPLFGLKTICNRK